MSTAHIAERQKSVPEPVAVPPTSRRRKAVIAVFASGLLLGIAGGSVAAYVLAIERSRAADSQRLQEQAESWLRTHGSR